jgi:hypothetical protein
MSTGFRGAYIRGIENLRQDDGVDAGLVSDALVNNCGHLFDAHHGHIVNVVSETGLADALHHPDPSSTSWRLLARWPFNLIRAPIDGGSAKVVYRLGIYRSGGAGTIYVGVRIGSTRVEPFTNVARTYSTSHSTTNTTPTTFSGSLYVSAENLDARHPGLVVSGDAAGAFPPRAATIREAWFELWCLFAGTKPTVRVSSVMARQFARL